MKRFTSFISIVVFTIMCIFLLVGCKTNFQLNFIVDGEVYKTIKTNGKEVISLPHDPIKEGYTFDGWYWDNDVWNEQFTARSLLDAPLSNNMNVYAHFIDGAYLEGTNIEIEGANKVYLDGIGDVFLINVSNSQVVFKFNDYVRANPQTTWTLSTDIAGNNIINTKTVELQVGDNMLYYIYVTDKNNRHEFYIVLIHRNYMFTVSFNANGGSACGSVQVEEGSFLEEIPTPSKKGSEFVGWDYDFQKHPITKNINTKASWRTIKYEITLDANGGDVAFNKFEAIYSETYFLPTPTRNGYNFLGWQDKDGNYINRVSYATQNMTFVAQWKNATYNITYDLDGGKISNNPTSYQYGDSTSIPNPTKKGYSFVGWKNLDELKGKDYVIDSNTYGDIELVATYQPKKYNMFFDADGGSCDVQSLEVEYDSKYTLPNASKNGYTFDGWYDGSQKINEAVWTTTNDVNLKAKWTLINYTIKYNMNEGKNSSNNPSTFTINSSDISIINPNRTGYTFTGWTTTNNDTPTKDLVIKAGTSYNLELTANWDANHYTITYDVNGGDALNSETMDVYYDFNYDLVVPNREGYTFLGWYDNDNKITSGTWKVLNDLSLKAKWQLETYQITYILNGGTNDNANPNSFTYEDDTIIIKDPSQAGYTFLGWTNSKSDTPLKNYEILHNSTKSITLYANWEAKTGISYKVEHYWQNIDDDYFSIHETEVLFGETDTLSNAVAKTYEGFSSPVVNQQNINGDGQTVVVLNYTRNTYSLSLNKNIDKAGMIEGTGNYKFGKTVVIKAETNPGFTFEGWYNNDELYTNEESFNWLITASETAFEARYSINKYTISIVNNSENIVISGITSGSKYEYNSLISLAATGIPSGYSIKWVRSDEKEYYGDAYSFNVPDEGITISILLEELPYTRDNNIVYFGKYPQTKVANSQLKTELNTMAGEKPTSTNNYNWTSYNYYISSEICSYMYYQDIDYDGNGTYDYRGVYFTKYRPKSCSRGSSKDDTFQYENGYSTGSIYWFSYDPIKWLILKEKDNSLLIIADLVLDNQEFYSEYSDKEFEHNGGTGYSNNYELSNIRKFLNENFYNVAFDSLQKSLIEVTAVKTGSYSTNDKIFLLSTGEVKEYRQIATPSTTRSEYAKAQGAGDGYWIIRTPSTNVSVVLRTYMVYGDPTGMDANYLGGIRPACYINYFDSSIGMQLK